MKKLAAIITLSLCSFATSFAWEFHFKPKIDKAVGQIAFPNGSMAFVSTTNYVGFGSTNLVTTIQQDTLVNPSNGTVKVLADGFYSIDMVASWEGPSQDTYYGAFTSNGAVMAYGHAREQIKNSNDDAHMSIHSVQYFKRNDMIGVALKSDNAAGGTLFDYVFSVTKY